MKFIKLPTLLLFAATILAACNSKTAQNTEEQDTLQVTIEQQQHELELANEFVALYNENMDSVLASNNIIFGDSESPALTKQKIKQNIAAYNELLNRQRAKIQELEKSLANSKTKNAAQLKKAIARMQEIIDAKDAEIKELQAKLDEKDVDIANLKTEVESLNSNVSSLQEQNRQQEDAITAQTNAMNEAYYIVGSSKELKNMGLVKSKKIEASNVDQSRFTKIDIREKTSINIPGKKPKVLSQMPASSYYISSYGDGTSVLNITNAKQFWSLTKYLVISY